MRQQAEANGTNYPAEETVGRRLRGCVTTVKEKAGRGVATLIIEPTVAETESLDFFEDVGAVAKDFSNRNFASTWPSKTTVTALKAKVVTNRQEIPAAEELTMTTAGRATSAATEVTPTAMEETTLTSAKAASRGENPIVKEVIPRSPASEGAIKIAKDDQEGTLETFVEKAISTPVEADIRASSWQPNGI